MKTISKQPALVLTLILSASFTGSAQYHSSDETTIGVLVEPTFSGFGYNGLTPSITIGCSTYQIQIGPRFSFDKMTGNTPKKQQDRVWDIGYRYSFLLLPSVSIYGALHCEYGVYRTNYDWFYEYPSTSAEQPDFGETHSFNARTSEKQHNLNFYLGAGCEFIAVNKLYFTIYGAGGMKTLTGHSSTIDMDADAMISTTEWKFDQQGASWMASLGVGYRL